MKGCQRNKEFLKRKRPVTSLKSSKPTKYKYYAERFSENPFEEDITVTVPAKPVVKKKQKAPFSNIARRTASIDTSQKVEQPEKISSKPKTKKKFLQRGGGTGGGIGPKESVKEPVEDRPKKKETSNSVHKSNKSIRGIFEKF